MLAACRPVTRRRSRPPPARWRSAPCGTRMRAVSTSAGCILLIMILPLASTFRLIHTSSTGVARQGFSVKSLPGGRYAVRLELTSGGLFFSSSSPSSSSDAGTTGGSSATSSSRTNPASPGAKTTTVRVRVKRSARNPVDTSQLMAYGSVFYVNGYNDDGWVMMQTISGVVEEVEETGRDGSPKEVVAVVAPGKCSPGSSVLVEARHMVAKPKNLDWVRGAHLPFQAVNCLCPILAVGVNESSARGQTFVVTGGHGSLAPFVVQVLKAWCGNVCCVTTKNEGAVRMMGAKSALVFRKKSYSEELGDIRVVVDTLGREKEGSQRMLKEAKGAAYVSIQPKVLKVAVEEGVLFGTGKIMQYQKMIANDDARTYFLPNAEAMSVVSKVATMVSSQTVELGGVGTEYVGMQEYMEALAWPKDMDSGLRYGFPAKTKRSWGWLEGGGYDEDGAYRFEDEPWEEDDEGEEEGDDEFSEDDDISQKRAGGLYIEEGDGKGFGGGGGGGGGDSGVATVPTGQVVRVNSREQLRALAGEGGTMVFVSSKGCRACKFLSPFYRKLARKQQLVWFGHVDASAHPELARDLGMKAVPGFVTFRGGEVVTATNTSSKQKIEKLVKELLSA